MSRDRDRDDVHAAPAYNEDRTAYHSRTPTLEKTYIPSSRRLLAFIHTPHLPSCTLPLVTFPPLIPLSIADLSFIYISYKYSS